MVPIETQTGVQQHLTFTQAASRQGTGLLCGEVRFQHNGSHFLLDALPAFFIIRHSSDNHWLRSLLDMIIEENIHTKPASKSVVNRLSELLFTYALRQYLEDNPNESGMLVMYGDSKLVSAIRCIHEAPETNWTLERLAKKAGFSRTVFSERFKRVSGWTAGQYLIWWRMQLAWSFLTKGQSVTQVATAIGYQSDSAFTRAFIKMFAVSPGKVRRGL